MKMMMATATLLAAVSCGSRAPKVLVLYYSQNGGTKAVAEEIASRLGADLEEIVSLNPYDGDFQATIARCQEEQKAGILPEVQPLKADLAAYDIVFLGYPVWFGTYAPPVGALLGKIDLSGKKVVPFCTFGSGGLDSSTRDLVAAQPGAEVLPGYGVRAARLDAVPAEVDQFLKASGFLEGEYFQPDPFGEQQPVTEEEEAIFDAAVNGYPMFSGKASTVASRALQDGVEYLFTALPLPREGGPDAQLPPPSPMQVYVTALEGQTPVFTQIVR